MPEWWWFGIILSAALLVSAWQYTRSVRNPEDWKLFHTLVLLLGTCGAAGIALLGAMGLITLFF